MPEEFTGYCLKCGYSLHGLEESSCPECGHGFDRNQPWSYSSVPSSRRLWFTGPPTWYVQILLIVFTAWAIYRFSEWRSLDLRGLCVSFVVMGCVLLDYCVRALRTGRYKDYIDRSSVSRWIVTPLCMVLILSLLPDVSWPLRVRFLLSKSAFEQMQTDFQSGKTIVLGNQQVGYMQVLRVTELSIPQIESPVFEIGTLMIDYVGIAKCSGRPDCGHRKLSGSWCLVYW